MVCQWVSLFLLFYYPYQDCLLSHWRSRWSVRLWILGSWVPFPVYAFLVLSLGKIFHLTLPMCIRVPVLLGKFLATDWSRLVGPTCLPNVMEIWDWLRPYGLHCSKKTNFILFPSYKSIFSKEIDKTVFLCSYISTDTYDNDWAMRYASPASAAICKQHSLWVCLGWTIQESNAKINSLL